VSDSFYLLPHLRTVEERYSLIGRTDALIDTVIKSKSRATETNRLYKARWSVEAMSGEVNATFHRVGLVIIRPSISAIDTSSEGGCLSSAMLRAKIDLRQPSFLHRPRTVTATVSSQGLKNTRFPRFGPTNI